MGVKRWWSVAEFRDLGRGRVMGCDVLNSTTVLYSE